MGIDQLDTEEIMKLIDWLSAIGEDSSGGILDFYIARNGLKRKMY